MKIAGIDVSTKAIDLVLLDFDTDVAWWQHYDLQAGDLIDRVMSVRHVLPHPGSVFWSDILAIGIERPAGRYGVPQVSMVFGAVLAGLPQSTLVKAWLPAEWKRACGLKGNAAKADVYEWNRERFAATDQDGVFVSSQDACDAYCVAYATRSVLERAAGEDAA